MPWAQVRQCAQYRVRAHNARLVVGLTPIFTHNREGHSSTHANLLLVFRFMLTPASCMYAKYPIHALLFVVFTPVFNLMPMAYAGGCGCERKEATLNASSGYKNLLISSPHTWHWVTPS
eukprot:scaffold206925_cov33-Tisochrysis_lutea.AAC.2